MSLEDLSPDFQSDESDDEVEKILNDDEIDGIGQMTYLDLHFMLHWNLMCFHNIYINNAIIDMQYAEAEDELNSDYDGIYSEMVLMRDYISSVLHHTPSPIPSLTYSHIYEPSSEDSFLSCSQDSAELFEDDASESSSYGSSDYSDAAEEEIYWLTEEAAECWL